MKGTIAELLREGMTYRQVINKLGLSEDDYWQVEEEDPLRNGWRKIRIDEHEYKAMILLEVR